MLACTMVYGKFDITSIVADFAEQIKKMPGSTNLWKPSYTVATRKNEPEQTSLNLAC
jgi:hypothetical protein